MSQGSRSNRVAEELRTEIALLLSRDVHDPGIGFVTLTRVQISPEGDRSLLDNTVLMYVHEHAEAGPHKTSGMIALVAGSREKIQLGRHTKIAGTIGDLYTTVFDGVMGAGLGKVPTANRENSPRSEFAYCHSATRTTSSWN